MTGRQKKTQEIFFYINKCKLKRRRRLRNWHLIINYQQISVFLRQNVCFKSNPCRFVESLFFDKRALPSFGLCLADDSIRIRAGSLRWRVYNVRIAENDRKRSKPTASATIKEREKIRFQYTIPPTRNPWLSAFFSCRISRHTIQLFMKPKLNIHSNFHGGLLASKQRHCRHYQLYGSITTTIQSIHIANINVPTDYQWWDSLSSTQTQLKSNYFCWPKGGKEHNYSNATEEGKTPNNCGRINKYANETHIGQQKKKK